MSTSAERQARYRARRRGENVPLQQPGPRRGFKQGESHVAKRKRWGAAHHASKGDAVADPREGRKRAERRFVAPACSSCGGAKAERHPRDLNPLNNSPDNIAILCRKCHMAA